MKKSQIIIPAVVFLTFLLVFLFISVRKLPAFPRYGKMPSPISSQLRKAYLSAKLEYTSSTIGNLGNICHANTYYKEAEKCYLLAISRDSSDWRWHYYIGYLYSELGDNASAIRYLERSYRLNHNAHHAAYYLAEALSSAGKTDEALRIFSSLGLMPVNTVVTSEERSTLHPLPVYAKFRMARILHQRSENDSALSILLSLTKDFPDFGPAFKLLSNVYALIGDHKKSIENSIRATELIPFYQPADSLSDRLAIISRSPEFIMKQIDIASISNPLYAKKLFDNSWPFMNDNPEILSKGLKVYINLGVTGKLADYCNLHLELFRNDPAELFNIGSLAFKKGMFGIAEIYFAKGLESDPGNYLARLRLSLCQIRTGKSDIAIANLDRLYNQNPDSLKILNAKVSSYMFAGKKDKAELIISQLEDLNPHNPDIYYLRGKMALLNNNKKLADENFLKALSGMPGDLELIQYAGLLYSSNGKWDSAIRLYRESLELLPTEPVILERYGDMLLNCPREQFRDTLMAGYYLERAFYSMKSGLNTKFHAGMNLVRLYAGSQQRAKAEAVINMLFFIAGKGNVSDEEAKSLKDLYDTVFSRK